ncbi:reactive oxygen species modulator 1 [Nematostella vectensis]|uniref:reactive oxygen species modulator 1 n=1 Tax=Nematostella vectensis TaxID=45351 RepID=UPI00138FC7D4|nr:reactive oxygen species modulator 1 [Nematostella vectensis]
MQRAPQPSCFDRVKVGFMIGFAVGMSSAGLFGTYSALRGFVSENSLSPPTPKKNPGYGLRGRELMSSVGKLMLQGGGTFGVFMSVGTAIRC